MGLKRKVTNGHGKKDKTEGGKTDVLRHEPFPPGSEAGQRRLAPEDVEDGYVHYSSSGDDIQPQSDRKRSKHGPTELAAAEQADVGAYDADDADDAHDAEGNRNDNDDNSDEDDDEEGEDEDDDEAAELVLKEANEGESDIEVTLEFHDPREDDVTAIDSFMVPWSQLFQKRKTDHGRSLDTMKLADAVCSQTRVGTMVRVGEEEAPVGFISCLNIRRHTDLLSPIWRTIEETAGKESPVSKLLSTCIEGRGKFEREKMGLILCQRVVNFPPQVIPKLLEALFSEISWAIEDEPTLELREDYRFGWYIYITEGLFQTSSDTAYDLKADETVSTDESEFIKVEDEAWWNVATHRILWNIPGNDVDKTGVVRKAVALIIAASNVGKARKQVTEMLGVIVDDDDEDSGSKTTPSK